MDGDWHARVAAIRSINTRLREDGSPCRATLGMCTLNFKECPRPGWTQRQAMRKFAIVVEKGENSLSAYVPDLPGCITKGRTTDEIVSNIRGAIALHLEGLLEDGEPISEPQ